jgi:hypothetical protein
LATTITCMRTSLAWLAPLVFVLLGFGGLLALAAAAPAISPFVYLLF